ncbi:MAG: hypothetical protein O2800_04460 [Planctomycetota bacterium]|nr:hypothetical protein [Planctomycetota bacterium]
MTDPHWWPALMNREDSIDAGWEFASRLVDGSEKCGADDIQQSRLELRELLGVDSKTAILAIDAPAQCVPSLLSIGISHRLAGFSITLALPTRIVTPETRAVVRAIKLDSLVHAVVDSTWRWIGACDALLSIESAEMDRGARTRCALIRLWARRSRVPITEATLTDHSFDPGWDVGRLAWRSAFTVSPLDVQDATSQDSFADEKSKMAFDRVAQLIKSHGPQISRVAAPA